MQYYFGIVGFVLLLMGCYLAVRRISIVLTGVRTVGKIDAYHIREHEGSKYFFLVVTFEDAIGKTHRFISASATGIMLKNLMWERWWQLCIRGEVQIARLLPAFGTFVLRQ